MIVLGDDRAEDRVAWNVARPGRGGFHGQSSWWA